VEIEKTPLPNLAMLVSMLKSGTLYDPARRGGAAVAEAS
jgi:hypothetical protein